jgi:amino-acid N-acetyltransferase
MGIRTSTDIHGRCFPFLDGLSITAFPASGHFCYNEGMSARLRKARVADVLGIQRLINGFAERDEMLPRALHELYENLRDFFVVEVDEDIVGCAALHINWANLAEVKSVAVAESCRRQGIGRLLIDACIADARALGISTLFCLTYRPEFFGALGFSVVDRGTLPRKVWSECVNCAKFSNCTEIAMSVQVLDAPLPAPTDPLVSLAAMPKR